MPENPRIEELRRRVHADPASIAFAALAEEFRRVGRHEDAIATCRTGLQRHPAYLSARVTLGRALIEVGDYEPAREELETVLRSAPENLAALRGLALINERLGHSVEMHPDLHALAQEPIRLAAENRARESELPPPAAPEPALQLAPAPEAPALEPGRAQAVSSLGTFNLSLSTPLEPASIDDEPKTGAPFDIFGAALNRTAAPHAHVAVMLTRLERFLGAIETARSA